MDNHTTTTRWSHEEVAAVQQVKSMEEKKANIRRAEKPQALNCPRCTSSHTKFCYYNNYNLSQPRYFCKACRRYWTAGGSLRNVPVGGASRKNKRSSSYDHMMMIMPPAHDQTPSQNPSHHHIIQNHGSTDLQHHLNSSTSSSMGIFFKTSTTTVGNDYATGMMMMNSFMPTPLVASSNPMVCVNGFQNDDENNIINHHQDATGARLFFPLEDLKPSSASSSTSHENHQMQGHDHSNSYWSGGGSW